MQLQRREGSLRGADEGGITDKVGSEYRTEAQRGGNASCRIGSGCIERGAQGGRKRIPHIDPMPGLIDPADVVNPCRYREGEVRHRHLA
jgi:hypothetical protein